MQNFQSQEVVYMFVQKTWSLNLETLKSQKSIGKQKGTSDLVATLFQRNLY